MIFLLVFLVLLLFLAAAFWTYRFTFYSPKGKQNEDHTVLVSPQMEPMIEDVHRMIDEINAVPYEPVSITSHDGLRLRGRYYHQSDDAPLALCFHGYRGTPSRDFSGGSQILLRQGFNVLLVEERAHCGSEGHTITFGVKERLDCMAWVNHFHYRFPEAEMLLFGISMGAATVLMSMALPMPEYVRGVVADCPFTEPKAIIRHVAAGLKIPGWIAVPLAFAAAGIFGHFNLGGASALEAVREAKKPILLIHGEEDDFVPCGMSLELQEANPALTERHTFPGASHGISFLLDPERYERLIADFAARVLTGGKERKWP